MLNSECCIPLFVFKNPSTGTNILQPAPTSFNFASASFNFAPTSFKHAPTSFNFASASFKLAPTSFKLASASFKLAPTSFELATASFEIAFVLLHVYLNRTNLIFLTIFASAEVAPNNPCT